MTDSLSSIIYIEEIVHDMVLRSSVFTDRFLCKPEICPRNVWLNFSQKNLNLYLHISESSYIIIFAVT